MISDAAQNLEHVTPRHLRPPKCFRWLTPLGHLGPVGHVGPAGPLPAGGSLVHCPKSPADRGLGRVTSYTDLNREIAERTGLDQFDFAHPEGRNMKAWLGCRRADSASGSCRFRLEHCSRCRQRNVMDTRPAGDSSGRPRPRSRQQPAATVAPTRAARAVPERLSGPYGDIRISLQRDAEDTPQVFKVGLTQVRYFRSQPPRPVRAKCAPSRPGSPPLRPSSTDAA